MKLRLNKIIGFLFVIYSGLAQSQEITAIDFNGDLIGKVIPDGKVVSFDNQLIGNITADSLIVDFKGNLIGGVIPRGIAIGNDNQLLGKVNNDGTVRLSTGKIVGKVLPNGLVVNENFDVLGAVLFPGLVYSDNGETVGRLTGDGLYTNLQGKPIGFISPDGYAYRRVGEDYALDGKLISSKMVISENGKFIGSVAPGGKVTDFNGKQIGFIKANGFAYNADNKIIGGIVRSGYAFDIAGKYMGLVTYNGEVLNKEKVIGYLQLDGSIIDNGGNVTGFMVDIAATISDPSGKYLGRLMPEGKIAKGRDIVGRIGPWNVAYDQEGKQIGQAILTGPIFNYNGKLIGHALKNSKVILPSGSPLGYVRDNFAFSSAGRLIGAVLSPKIVMDSSNKILGINGISSTLSLSDDIHTVSPFGYVFNSDGTIDGHATSLGLVYALNGDLAGNISPNGSILDKGSNLQSHLTQYGLNVDEKNHILGGTITAKYAVSDRGNNMGILADGNQILDKSLKTIAKILPDNRVISYKSSGMPTIGSAFNAQIALAYSGSLLGYVDNQGQVKDPGASIIGKVNAQGIVLDNSGIVIGEVIGFHPVINSECGFLGVITPDGSVKNYRDVTIGKIISNGQVIAEDGNVAGYSVVSLPITGNGGNPMGVLASNGKAINVSNENIGCLNINRQLLNNQENLIGHLAESNSVIDFNGNIIGRSLIDGSVVDDTNKIIGYELPDSSVNNNNGTLLGAAFKYRYAFGFDNKIIGTINANAEVINQRGEVIAKTDFIGNVISNGNKIGYALYDMYMYNNDNETVGYIASNGNIMSFDNRKLGRMVQGFGVNNFNKLFARGNRDFYIRDEDKNIIGYLNFDGNVMSNEGQKIGSLASGGAINNAKGALLAKANPLQYYEPSRQPVYDANGNIIGYVDENNNVDDYNGNIIGTISEDGSLRDADGTIIGNTNMNWYRGPITTDKGEKLPEVGSLTLKEKDYKKSVNIALTPDGEYLGDILEDGNVINKDGDILGKRLPDGLIVDNEGSLIGIEETAKKPNSGEIFVPNSFGSGEAYGTGQDPTNLGPGGGYGPGERYNSQRSAALSAVQGVRRQNMEVGKISTTYSKEAFDGKQKDWGIPKTISTWPVDMDMMILADKPIPAVIARSIDTEHEVPVTAFVERNVYAEDGRNVVIPAGSRLIGSCGGSEGGSEEASPSARITITWERLIMPNGVMFDMSNAKSADAQGRGGVLGYLDRQLFKKYALPFVTNLATSGLSILFATDEESKGENESSRQQAMNDARENFLDNTQNMFDQIIQDRADIRAITFVPAGTRIIVYPGQDLWLRTIDDDAEDSSGSAAGKATILADDTELSEGGDGRISGEFENNNGTNSQVVYNESSANAQPVSSNNGAQQNTGSRRNNIGATPPPPSTNVNVQQRNNKDDETYDTDVPQLF